MSVDVWAVWPTVQIEKTREMIEVWREMGYKIAVLINPPHVHTDLPTADRVIEQRRWRGFPCAANVLCAETPGQIAVVVGDDLYPDQLASAQEIGEDFLNRFPDLYGVMQPTGDDFGWTHKCAVSPWLGRAFIERAYNGAGPFREEYWHYFSDQELQEYATQHGVFQQRPDLTQFHDHWQRKDGGQRPPYLYKAKRLWKRDKRTFEERKQKGFPSGALQPVGN